MRTLTWFLTLSVLTTAQRATAVELPYYSPAFLQHAGACSVAAKAVSDTLRGVIPSFQTHALDKTKAAALQVTLDKTKSTPDDARNFMFYPSYFLGDHSDQSKRSYFESNDQFLTFNENGAMCFSNSIDYVNPGSALAEDGDAFNQSQSTYLLNLGVGKLACLKVKGDKAQVTQALTEHQRLLDHATVRTEECNGVSRSATRSIDETCKIPGMKDAIYKRQQETFSYINQVLDFIQSELELDGKSHSGMASELQSPRSDLHRYMEAYRNECGNIFVSSSESAKSGQNEFDESLAKFDTIMGSKTGKPNSATPKLHRKAE